MKKAQQQVRDFMVKAEQSTPAHPTIPSDTILRLRCSLIKEELRELKEALGITDRGGEPDLALAYDAILDILFVTIGAAVSLGLELEPGWEEVCRSNMSKFIDGYKSDGTDGNPEGKWIKGPSYSPARLGEIVDAQLGQARLI